MVSFGRGICPMSFVTGHLHVVRCQLSVANRSCSARSVGLVPPGKKRRGRNWSPYRVEMSFARLPNS